MIQVYQVVFSKGFNHRPVLNLTSTTILPVIIFLDFPQ